MQWPWKTSLLLMIFGFLVVFFSVQSMHGKAIAQEMADPNAILADEYQLQNWLDPKLPGSLPYQVGRASDRIELLTMSPEDKPEEQCARAKERLEASRYAWEKNHRREAVKTIHKALIYISQAKSQESSDLTDDLARDCSQTSQEIQATLQGWCQQTSCQQESFLSKTLVQAETI